jgi:hypothetical protein
VREIMPYTSHRIRCAKQPGRTQHQGPRQLDSHCEEEVPILNGTLMPRHVGADQFIDGIFNQEGTYEGHGAIVLRVEPGKDLIDLRLNGRLPFWRQAPSKESPDSELRHHCSIQPSEPPVSTVAQFQHAFGPEVGTWTEEAIFSRPESHILISAPGSADDPSRLFPAHPACPPTSQSPFPARRPATRGTHKSRPLEDSRAIRLSVMYTGRA